jgi:ATP-dependent exoDNAse (exonuclease V) alpha subunit
VHRELGTIEKIDANGNISLRLEDNRTVHFNAAEHPHFDHGYAVTSYGSQGLTADRVLINIDSAVHPDLINSRFAYVAISRASLDAEIYTNDATDLGHRLSDDVSKSSAVEFSQSADHSITDFSLGQDV